MLRIWIIFINIITSIIFLTFRYLLSLLLFASLLYIILLIWCILSCISLFLRSISSPRICTFRKTTSCFRYIFIFDGYIFVCYQINFLSWTSSLFTTLRSMIICSAALSIIIPSPTLRCFTIIRLGVISSKFTLFLFIVRFFHMKCK